MNSLIRFFEKGRERVLKEYEDIPIPYIGATVYIDDEPYKVYYITYDFKDERNSYNLIDIFVNKEKLIDTCSNM
jgi:hypothetical protein